MPTESDRTTREAIRRLLAGEIDDGASGPPFDVLLAHWPDPQGLLSLRRRALVAAWTALPFGADRLAICRALGAVAGPARKILIEGAGVDRQRATLEAEKRANLRNHRRVRKVYRRALGRLVIVSTAEGTRIDRDSRKALNILGRALKIMPALVLDCPLPAIGPLGPITRRDSRDPLSKMKRLTIAGLTRAGLRGRKFAALRALLLFAVGLLRSFDPKQSARARGLAVAAGRPAPTLATFTISAQGQRLRSAPSPEKLAQAFIGAFERGPDSKKTG